MTADGDVKPGKAQRREVEECVCVVQVNAGGAIKCLEIVLVLRDPGSGQPGSGRARSTSIV